MFALALGCDGPGGSVAPMGHVARIAGVSDAIVFQSSGGPADVAYDSHGTLSLSTAVRLAVANDPDLQAALARVRAAEADARQTRLLPNPVITVLARFPESSGKPVIEAELGVEIVSLLQMPGRISAADSRLRAASAEAASIVLDVVKDVQQTYAAVQSLDALMPVLEERRNLLMRLLALAKDRLDKGEGTLLDVTTLDTQRLELQVEISEKRLERRQQRLALARLVAQPSSEADWRVDPWQIAPRQAWDEKAWMAAALAHRPDIQAQRWELAALGDDYALTRFAPFDSTDAGAKSERDQGEKWTVGPSLTVPLPLFDWGQARRAKARALQVEARHKLTKLRRQAIEEVRSAVAAFNESADAEQLAREELIPAQERRRRQTDSAYQAGQIDITTLIIADQDLQASRAKLIELEQKTSMAFILLQRAAGGSGIAPHTTEGASATRPAARLVSPSIEGSL